MRVVLDTNVLIAGVLTPGLCQALFDLFMASESLVIITCEELLGEFRRIAIEKFGTPAAEIDRFIELVRRRGVVVRPAGVEASACRDADDLVVLGTALSGDAAFIVTGDADLLMLGKFEGIPIESPRTFYERLR